METRGITQEDIINELNSKLQIPGVTNDGRSQLSIASTCYLQVSEQMLG
jgi:hypothetical protein